MKDQRKKRVQKISETLGWVTKDFTTKFGKREFIIHSKWEEMVGDFFNEYIESMIDSNNSISNSYI